jgi:hypothetical protein
LETRPRQAITPTNQILPGHPKRILCDTQRVILKGMQIQFNNVAADCGSHKIATELYQSASAAETID